MDGKGGGMGGSKGGGEGDYVFVLPVLFWEFLAIAVTKSLMPSLMNNFWGDSVYYVIGVSEAVKGVLAFGACPLFGRLSDLVGRKRCLLVTVIGTTLPVCSLAFTTNLWVYVVCHGLSGVFASTFTLVFAYIADYVPRNERAPAYGLALATFGLSFSIGPIAGSYLHLRADDHAVFVSSLVLSVFDVLYIIFVLPESKQPTMLLNSRGRLVRAPHADDASGEEDEPMAPNEFNPFDAISNVFKGDALLTQVAKVVFLYYMGVWAVVATMVVYVVRTFHFTKMETGYLLSAYGVTTMLSEAVLVRYAVPRLGERMCLRIGLFCFAVQCAMLALATSRELVYASILLSIGSNLVYPSVSSIVSRAVPASQQGQAQGAMNGVKAVTEGIGPLLFAWLMQQFEGSALPGFPYLIAGAVVLLSLFLSFSIPSEVEYESQYHSMEVQQAAR